MNGRKTSMKQLQKEYQNKTEWYQDFYKSVKSYR